MRNVCSFVLLLLFFFLSGCSLTNHVKKYRIGIDPSLYPYNFGSLQNNINAYINEVLLEISKLDGIEIEKVPTNWDNLLDGLEGTKKKPSQYDFVITLMHPYNFNLDKYSFSKIFLETGPSFVIRKGTLYDNLKDLSDKRVGIVRGDLAIQVLQKSPNIVIINYSSIGEMLNELEKRNIEAAVTFRPFAVNYIKNIYPDKFSMTKPILEQGLRFVSKKGQGSQMRKLDSLIKKMTKNKTLEQLQKKWSLML